MSWTPSDIPDLGGRTAVVTGANAGLGLEITAALAARGAHVVMACRNTVKAEAAADAVRRRSPGARLEVRTLDLADLDSVAAFADGLLGAHDRLDVLVNNAGLMAVDESRTAQGFEMQFGVNHLGHFALTARVLPLLLATPGSRIGTMSSMGHRAARGLPDPRLDRPYRRWQAYFRSKLANLLFTAELQRRLAGAGASTIAVAAHPGGSHTELGREGTSVLNRVALAVAGRLAQSAEAGARPMLRAVTDPAVRGGEFYGPRHLLRGAAPVRETPSRAARDADAARRLWDRSVELTGLEPAVVAVRRSGSGGAGPVA
ncbi:MAG TPA: oxidoreductase [Pseudonocardia sp.]|nr:oxidoreductase [Pseudonocardia sp.]